jgi:hypothetical protein
MILLAYILLGHPDWKKGVIKIFSFLPESDLDEAKEALYRLARSGRLPISAQNLEFISTEEGKDRRSIIQERSRDADLVLMGFRGEALRRQKGELFTGYEGIGNILFVNTTKEIEIVSEEEETGIHPEPVAGDGDDPTDSTKKKARDSGDKEPGDVPESATEDR